MFHFSYTHIIHIIIFYLTFVRHHFYSKQIENIISKAYNNNKVSKYGYRVNMELNPFNEGIIYREYIICLKKHQLALE